MRFGLHYPLASSNVRIPAGDNCSRAAAKRSFSWSVWVALAMGAVMPGRAISHESATAAGVDRCSFATASSAAKIRNPRG